MVICKSGGHVFPSMYIHLLLLPWIFGPGGSSLAFLHPVVPFFASLQRLHVSHHVLHLYPILFLFSVAPFAGMVPAVPVLKVKTPRSRTEELSLQSPAR